jgi:hypothetical protein
MLSSQPSDPTADKWFLTDSLFSGALLFLFMADEGNASQNVNAIGHFNGLA